MFVLPRDNFQHKRIVFTVLVVVQSGQKRRMQSGHNATRDHTWFNAHGTCKWGWLANGAACIRSWGNMTKASRYGCRSATRWPTEHIVVKRVKYITVSAEFSLLLPIANSSQLQRPIISKNLRPEGVLWQWPNPKTWSPPDFEEAETLWPL